MTRRKQDDHTIKDGRTLPIFIHSVIDDMTHLSPDTMRVYMHLSRRADKSGAAWPSYQSIGDHCFISVYKHADGRRKHAVAAIAELVKAGLLKKDKRTNEHGQQTNCYTLIDPVTLQSQPVVTEESQGVSDATVTAAGTLQSQRAVTPEAPDPVTLQSPKDTPLEGTPLEGTPKDDEEGREPLGRDPVADAWREHYGELIPENIDAPIRALALKHGLAAVSHGIQAGAKSGSRNFGYIAKCARNYLPPASTNGKGSYQVDLPEKKPEFMPGVHTLTPPAKLQPPALPLPMPNHDPWSIALAELRPVLPGTAMSYLAGSCLEAVGDVDGVPLYRIVVEERAAVGVGWLTTQVGPAIRRKLGSLLGRPVLIEIVAAESVAELEPTP